MGRNLKHDRHNSDCAITGGDIQYWLKVRSSSIFCYGSIIIILLVQYVYGLSYVSKLNYLNGYNIVSKVT